MLRIGKILLHAGKRNHLAYLKKKAEQNSE